MFKYALIQGNIVKNILEIEDKTFLKEIKSDTSNLYIKINDDEDVNIDDYYLDNIFVKRENDLIRIENLKKSIENCQEKMKFLEEKINNIEEIVAEILLKEEINNG